MAKNDKNEIWFERIKIILGLTIIIVGVGLGLSFIFPLPVESCKNILQRVGVSLSLFGFLAMLISGSKKCGKDEKTGKPIWWVGIHRVNWIFKIGFVCMLFGILLQFWMIQ